MLRHAFCLMLHLTGVVMYNQSDYIINLERVEILDYNKNHVAFARTANSRYNRTVIATNFTFSMKTDFGNNLQVAVQAYKFSSNEYRLFPIVFTVNICDTISKNDFGLQNLYACGNFTRCPLKKGNYLICNWYPDESKFPPFIPPASYMLDLKILYRSLEVLHAQGYAAVKRIADFAPTF